MTFWIAVIIFFPLIYHVKFYTRRKTWGLSDPSQKPSFQHFIKTMQINGFHKLRSGMWKVISNYTLIPLENMSLWCGEQTVKTAKDISGQISQDQDWNA